VPQQLKAAFDAHQVDPARLKEKVLTATWALAAGDRSADASAAGAPSPRERRLAGRLASWRPTLPLPSRPRLVTVGALAAVAGVISVSASVALVGAVRGGGAASLAAGSSTGSRVLVTPPATPAVPAPTATGPAPTTAPTGTDRSGDSGAVLGAGQVGPGYAVQAVSVAGFPAGSELVLPQLGVVDWVVFGSGHNGVAAQAPLLFPPIDTSRLGSVGSARWDSSTSVSWSYGMPPRPDGSHDSERLRIPGGRSGTLSVFRGASAGRLLLYVGGAPRLRVTVTSLGFTSSTFAVPLYSQAGVVSLDLSGLGFWSSATVTLTGDGDTAFTMIAAVLR
jgi:hypothetical protein